MGSKYRHQVDAGLGGISSVVSSLPVGYTLGEARSKDEIAYRLFYNAGNSQIGPGYAHSAIPVGGGPYSVTITTVSKSANNVGGGVIQHATATTGTYFWGAVRGNVAGVVGDASSVPTGNQFYLGSDGQVELDPGSVMTGQPMIGINLGAAATKTVTTGAQSGDPFIYFE